uniref:folate receptor gamma-like n=1 Tax=Styela clava TaxID=7725 RepID=UPI00193A44B6|nr:folate receptor gamma-like [Styela clava]
MDTWWILICVFCGLIWNGNAARLKSDQHVLNVCMDGKHHLHEPTSEKLYGLCQPWEANACCSNETAYHSQKTFSFLYNLNLSHCGEMSQKCLRRFYISHCFYECTPNVGPWIKSVRSSIRNERFFHVPLCKSDCDAWWDDCKDDLTCVDSFATGFVWHNNTNHCPVNNKCQSFKKWFHNSTNFCQTIYPDDFIVIQNSTVPCMKLEFNRTRNPNAKVAKKYAEMKNLYLGIKKSSQSPATTTTQSQKETVQPYVPPTKTPVLQQTGTIISIVLISLLIVGIFIGVLIYKCKDAILTRKRAGEGYLPSFAWFKQATNRQTTNRSDTVDNRPFLQAGEEDDDCDINPHGTLEIDL